ncbi:MAG TPA: LysR substrate-binding domain-containing protein [Ramlibacter sp.]|jgi:DNA-binding transcriptional LysR family regulator|nr:LysR substrate-binding domain-containing protein [Ramlibacter sp.]
MDIRKVDLNLLPVLDALLRLRSVTRAAAELDMSQSALSAALARLRALLADDLFVRTGRGLLPTSRATELAAPLAEILERVRGEVLQASGFDAKTDRREFRLILSDVGAYVLWPRIVRSVRAQAPGVTLHLLQRAGSEIADELAAGHADLAIGAYPQLPQTLFQRRLFERKFFAMVRPQHPLARAKKLGLRAFAEAAHIVVRMSSGVQDRIDEALAKDGLVRTDTTELPSYLMLPSMLEADDFLAVVPGQLADAFAQGKRFVVMQLPVSVPPSTIRVHWHRRGHQDAGNAWLRELIVKQLGAE